MKSALNLQLSKHANFATPLLCAAGLLAFFATTALAQRIDRLLSPPVTIETIDGTIVKGRWGGMESSVALTFETDAGATLLQLDELATVVFSIIPGDPAVGGTVFHLADGGRLVGDLLGSDGDSLVGRTSLSESTPFPFERLAGVELARRGECPQAAKRFAASLAARLPAKDVLVTCEKDNVKIVRGRIESLDPTSGKFVLDQEARSFKTEKIFGIVFAAGSSQRQRFPVTLHLRDASRISGTLKKAAPDRLSLTTSLGFAAEVSLDRLWKIIFHSSRLVYLTDLPIAGDSSEGRLHPKWGVGVDRNVAGGPLRIAGRDFARGLGMHSKGEVSYFLGGEYELFIATIGLDDMVRPRGSVVFKVLGDGHELFDSGLILGTDPPRDVRVDVRKVKRMTLWVGYGDGIDLSDYANWGNVRLIKPREGM